MQTYTMNDAEVAAYDHGGDDQIDAMMRRWRRKFGGAEASTEIVHPGSDLEPHGFVAHVIYDDD
jgi:hypothetical protein